MMDNATCRNCEKPLQSHYAYCPYCSQKSGLHRLSMHEVFHEALHYFTHADKGFFQLIRDLALKNGRVAKEYMEGKRKKYFPPLNFFLLAAAIFVFVSTFHQHEQRINTIKDIPSYITDIKDPVKQAIKIQVYKRQLEADWFMNKYSNILALFALPLTSFFFFLFYRKAKYNYTEHLVANMYMGGFAVLVSALVIIPVTRLSGMTGLQLAGIYFVFELAYFTGYYYRFMEKTTKAQFVKAFFTSFVAISSWFVLSSFMFGVYMYTGFWGLLD